MSVCKLFRMHIHECRNRRQHGSLQAKNKTLCTPLGVRRHVITLYLIYLNEVPKSTPYHSRNGFIQYISAVKTDTFKSVIDRTDYFGGSIKRCHCVFSCHCILIGSKQV